jgi:hypothetical protein
MGNDGQPADKTVITLELDTRTREMKITFTPIDTPLEEIIGHLQRAATYYEHLLLVRRAIGAFEEYNTYKKLRSNLS